MTIEIHSLELNRLEPAFKLATQVFAESSTLHRALGIGLNEYQEYLRRPFELMVSEGLSVAATDSLTDKLAGCLIVTDFAHEPTESTSPHPKLAPLTALTAGLCRQYKAKREVSVGEAILVDMGAVSKKAGGRGVYQKMRSAVHDAARNRGFKLVLGELSSVATQHVVLDLLGHRRMAEIAFADFKFGTELPFHAIHEPPSIILSERDL